MTRLSPVPQARAAVRWSLGHALPRTLLRRAAKQGDLHGRMFVATQSAIWRRSSRSWTSCAHTARSTGASTPR